MGWIPIVRPPRVDKFGKQLPIMSKPESKKIITIVEFKIAVLVLIFLYLILIDIVQYKTISKYQKQIDIRDSLIEKQLKIR